MIVLLSFEEVFIIHFFFYRYLCIYAHDSCLDRMLVSVFRCEHETLKFPFNEQESRITRGLDSKEWDEFLVIWKNRRIEIYEDYVRSEFVCKVWPVAQVPDSNLFHLFDEIMNCLISFPKPNKNLFPMSIYLPHDLNLTRALLQVLLINTQLVDP